MGKRKKWIQSVKNDGTLSSDTGDICEAFKHTFSDIYRATDHDGEDITVYKNIINQMEKDTQTNNDHALNEPIRMEELQKTIKLLQKGKAVGVDNIPNEIIKMPSLQPILHKLFETCFNSSISPEMRHKNIKHPILKPDKDSKCACSYRGISLMSTVAKLYNSIPNRRVTNYAEENILIGDEQNGFRRGRTCLDHLYSLTTILNNRISAGLSTFACFVDCAKAFDKVNHTLLMYKLLCNGIRRKMYFTIKHMYIYNV